MFRDTLCKLRQHGRRVFYYAFIYEYEQCSNITTVHFVPQLPVSMEEVVDLLNDVNQQLGDSGDAMDEEEEKEDCRRRLAHSSPAHPTETAATISHIKFSTPSPNKSLVSPSKRLVCCQDYLGLLYVFEILFLL